jgi:hypothetical protein
MRRYLPLCLYTLSWRCIHFPLVQGEHKRNLHFQNDTESKYGVLRTSYLHQSIEKYSKFCFKWPGDCCCCAPPLEATIFKNGYPTTEKLVCSAVSEEWVCNSCATCISHNFTWNHPAEYPFTPGKRQWITTATASITRDTLHKVWDELDYRLDIYRVTCGAHIESLCGVYKTLWVFLSTGVGVKF